ASNRALTASPSRARSTRSRGARGRDWDPPASQPALALHSGLLEHARRRAIVDVAHGPHPVHLGLRQRPVGHGADDFRHVAAAPVLAAEDVAELDAVGLGPDVDGAGQAAVLAHEDDPREWAVPGPAGRTVAEIVARVLGASVRAEAHVAGGLVIARVRREDRL